MASQSLARPPCTSLGSGTGPGSPHGLSQKLSILRNKNAGGGNVVFSDQIVSEVTRGHERMMHEPLEVNVIDTSTSTGTGGLGSAGDKSSPSTSGGAGATTTATASPRSIGALSSMTPSPGYPMTDPEAVVTSEDGMTSTSNSPGSSKQQQQAQEDESAVDQHRVSTYESEVKEDANEVILRRSMRSQQNVGRRGKFSYNNEAGRLLKSALDRHFRNSHATSNPDTTRNLDNYISEVFYQLDYHRLGSISRDDFQILCEILDLKLASRPPSTNFAQATYRLSGLEWLSSYRPRSPLSPIRMDKLSEVKFKSVSRTGSGGQQTQSTSQPQPPNFLFTLGPRPFWELWPQKRRRKRRLNIDEFKRALLEQWARSNGLSASRVSALFAPVSPTAVASADAQVTGYRTHRHVRSVRIMPTSLSSGEVMSSVDGAGTPMHNGGKFNQFQNGRPHEGGPRVHYETKTKRFFRSLARASRRVHFIRRLSRRLKRSERPQRPRTTTTVTPQEQQHQQNVRRPIQCVDTADYAIPAPSGSIEKQRRRVLLLEKQIQHQQTEITGLRDVVEDLRSSLQLSDAQNLALQVLLKKMAKESPPSTGTSLSQHSTQPHENVNKATRGQHVEMSADFRANHVGDRVDFRSKIMNESERHLENLVRELKEMSQIKYPTYNASTGGNGTSSTATSVHGFDDDNTSNVNPRSPSSNELKAVQEELDSTVGKLQAKEFEVEENSVNLREAYRALEKAQRELNKMR